MNQEVTASFLIAVVLTAVAAHVVVFVLSRKINVLFVLGAMFLLISPLSAATSLSLVTAAKYARVYITVLIVLIGVFKSRSTRFGPASKVLAAFTGFYLLASVWSYSPFWALVYKSFFALAIFSGLLLAYSARNYKDLARGLRIFGVVAALSGLVVFVVFLSDPEGFARGGRMTIAGLNPVRIGETAAPLLILCCYLALYDESKKWKALGYVVATLLALIIVYTGSRGAAGMAGVGFLMLVLPLSRRPIRLALVFAMAAGFGFLVLNYFEGPAIERLTNTEDVAGTLVSSRLGIWERASQAFLDSPLLGQGWAQSRGEAFGNLHSVYFQIAAEMGIAGLLLFAATILVTGFRCLQGYLSVGQHRPASRLASLGMALLLGCLASGIGNSAMMAGTMPVSVLFGLAVGLLDRFPEFTAQESRRRLLHLRFSRRHVPAPLGPRPI